MPAENQQVNPSFNISASNAPLEKPVLLVQAGKQGIALIQLDSDSNTFISLQVYHFARHLSNEDIAAEMNTILAADDLLQQHFKKIFITWCFDESILVPNSFFDTAKNNAMLELVYGDASAATAQNEMVLMQDLHTVYRIPVAVKNVFNSWFPFAIQHHQQSLLININKEQLNLLYCIFYPSHITVLLRQNNQLQVIQNFEFSTPQDAVYHLLNTCESFAADINQTNVILCGMIDADSSLYGELYKYFLHIGFASLPGNFNYTEEIKNYPAQYFSHLFATASCVL